MLIIIILRRIFIDTYAGIYHVLDLIFLFKEKSIIVETRRCLYNIYCLQCLHFVTVRFKVFHHGNENLQDILSGYHTLLFLSNVTNCVCVFFVILATKKRKKNCPVRGTDADSCYSVSDE